METVDPVNKNFSDVIEVKDFVKILLIISVFIKI